MNINLPIETLVYRKGVDERGNKFVAIDFYTAGNQKRVLLFFGDAIQTVIDNFKPGP